MCAEAVRYVAFLRGLNVGGHTVKMDRLRALFDELGYEAVETYIASGNVLFSTASGNPRELENAISTHLESVLGYAVASFVRSTKDLREIAAYRPFPDAELTNEGTSLYLAFLHAAPSRGEAERIQAAGSETDRFHVKGSELYWLCRTRYSDSPFAGPKLERLLGCPATVRNSTTIRKMTDRYGNS